MSLSSSNQKFCTYIIISYIYIYIIISCDALIPAVASSIVRSLKKLYFSVVSVILTTPEHRGLRPIYTVRCIARLIARSIENDQIALCKRDNLIARRIGQCIGDRQCVLDFWSPDQCLIARLSGTNKAELNKSRDRIRVNAYEMHRAINLAMHRTG